MVKVSPSILSADFACLGTEVQNLCQAGADFVHVDVMDGHFVPNLTFGAGIVQAIKPYSTRPLDVHLMISNPRKYIDDFINAGADYLIIHSEIEDNIPELLKHIRSCGVKAGICIKPGTSEESIYPYLNDLDLILIMTVEPGFGGQVFMEDMLPKIARVKEMVANYPINIEVDGGINDKTAVLAVRAGADILVSGSYLFKSENWQKTIQKLQGLKV